MGLSMAVTRIHYNYRQIEKGELGKGVHTPNDSIPTLFEETFDLRPMQSSSWYKDTPPTVNGLSSSSTNADIIRTGENIRPTAKMCPSINQLFRNAILVKAPCDFSVVVQGDDFMVRASDPRLEFESHHPEQWQYGGVFDNMVNIKIDLKFTFSMDRNETVMWTNPMFHGVSPFHLVNVPLTGRFLDRFNIQLQTFLPKQDMEVNVNKGDALAYLYFTKKPEMVFDPDLAYADKRHKPFEPHYPFPYKRVSKVWKMLKGKFN